MSYISCMNPHFTIRICCYSASIAYGDKNIVGKNIERLRKERGIKQKDFISRMQTMGCDINPTSYSKLEGQVRIATDKELFVIAKMLDDPGRGLGADTLDDPTGKISDNVRFALGQDPL